MHPASCILSALAVIASLATPTLVQADELRMTTPSGETANRPARGTPMDKVEATYGAPAHRVPAIGNPPITRWEYPGFVVYFERNIVLHTVTTLS